MSKGITKDGTSRVPSAYVCDGILFTNHKGEQLDIQHIVTEFSIQETIYSPTLMCSFSVRDAVSFLEFHEIIGQEVVEVKITKKDPKNEKKIDLKFFIVDYPLFHKSTQQDSVSAFKFTGVSRHAYLDQLKKVSKSYSGNAADIIFGLITEKETGLGFPKEKMIGFKDNKYQEDCSTFIKGVIPFSRPLNAVTQFVQAATDSKGSPFFLYQTLHGNMHFKSLSYLFDEEKNPQYGGPKFSYIRTTNFLEDPQTEADYLERMKRILKMSSDIKLNVIGQMKRGTYASRNNYLEISNKTYSTTSYDYTKDFKGNKSIKNSLSNIDTEWKIDEKHLGEYDTSHCTYTATNNSMFAGTELSLNQNKQLRGPTSKSHLELLETQTHNITLLGDVDLNAGTVISIVVPKSINNRDQKALLDVSEIEEIDELLSGRYLITGVKHMFKGGNMMSEIKIKRDSVRKSIA